MCYSPKLLPVILKFFDLHTFMITVSISLKYWKLVQKTIILFDCSRRLRLSNSWLDYERKISLLSYISIQSKENVFDVLSKLSMKNEFMEVMTSSNVTGHTAVTYFQYSAPQTISCPDKQLIQIKVCATNCLVFRCSNIFRNDVCYKNKKIAQRLT